KIVIDHRNLDHDRKHAAQKSWSRVGEDCFLLYEQNLDARTGFAENTWWIVRPKEGKVLERNLRIQFFTAAQWKRHLRKAGAKMLEIYPGFTALRPSKPRGPRLVMVAARRS
ncbi:MAG: hypothetical protein ACYTAF_09745, partial [Planctomycetota bacterium]